MPIHNFSTIMPALTLQEKGSNPSPIPVGSPAHPGIHAVSISHSMPSIRNKVLSSVISSNPVQSTSQQFQRLKVEDALSYLDQVKYKFGSQPQVYNDFLDIMKEFKSQSIDTPGVITRVSNLFKGHPELIVGFNTFLPPGYKIEVQSSDSGGYSFQVSVSIPSPSSSSSTMIPSTQTIVHTTSISNISSTIPTTNNELVADTLLPVVNSSIVAQPISLSSATAANLVSPVLNSPLSILVPTVPVVVPITSSVLNNPATTQSNVVSVTGTSPTSSTFTLNQAHQAVSQALIQVESGMANQPIPQNQPVEFNHAINYVNKIKNRFLGQPDKYKRFLEILHTYQKEQRTLKDNQLQMGGVASKTLTEAEVYLQVAKLFENQEDLLAEFGQFLPDATSHQSGFNVAKCNNTGSTSSSSSSNNDTTTTTTASTSSTATAAAATTTSNDSTFTAVPRKTPVNAKSCFNNAALNSNTSVSNCGGSTCNIPVSSNGGSSNNISSSSSTNAAPVITKLASNSVTSTTPTASSLLKRSSSMSNSHSASVSPTPPAVKKRKSPMLREISLTEAGKYGSLNDFAFFDRIRKAIHNNEMYKNFLRCFIIYNNEIINEAELLQLTSPFLAMHPELLKWFKEFIGVTDSACSTTTAASSTNSSLPPLSSNKHNGNSNVGNINNNINFGDEPTVRKASSLSQDLFFDLTNYNNALRPENSTDIDYTTCKRIGASYCAVPDDFSPPKCSGRTDLCREVLNDSWVSFPSYSEDSTFVSSRKTQYEEYIYRCEDERFELDSVIETNTVTIRVLDDVQKKMARMSAEEVAKFQLDDCLGGTSPSIHQRAIRRIYSDKAADILDGLKQNPSASVPVVLKRLKAKEEEWREAQKGFNKIWREQNEKFYLKSLDHQGINFKQNDMKYLRSKSLLNEIEALFDERQEQQAAVSAAGDCAGDGGATNVSARPTPHQPTSGPHLVLQYRDKSVLNDAANLLIHHVKRQAGIHKEDKQKIKSLIRQFIPDLFYHPRQDVSDDEREEVEEKSTKKQHKQQQPVGDDGTEAAASVEAETLSGAPAAHTTPPQPELVALETSGCAKAAITSTSDMSDVDEIKVPVHAISCHPDEHYTLFYADNHWYLFLRLHQILCDRLSKMYEWANVVAKQESRLRKSSLRKESAAITLRLKPKPEIEVEDYYPAMLDMVKNLLDGNIDSTTYEDTLREMFGIHAYNAFTLDKVVSHAVRQLQYLVSDETCQDCYEIFVKEKLRLATGGPCSSAHQRLACEANYQKKIESLSMESCFRILIYKIDCKITFECLDTDGDNDDTQENEKWNNFAENKPNRGDSGANFTEFNANNVKIES